MGKGGNRDWGYASYNVDDENDEKLTYTSYEKSGAVNHYSDNGDGGHSHSRWNDSDDYNNGKDADYVRKESNDSPNPSTGEVQENGGCYLTTACMLHKLETFNDDCYELTVLRWFRDNFVSKEDIKHYYQTAPIIVKAINEQNNCVTIYQSIYENVIVYCVKLIEHGNYELAYTTYKNSILNLEEAYARPALNQRLIRLLKNQNNKMPL